MDPKQYLEILQVASRLKTNTRHNWTDGERKESVADHSWRMTLMALLLDGVEEFKDVDFNRVIRMCLIHDLGEAFTGDIPAFEKSDTDADKEDAILKKWIESFPEPQRGEWLSLLEELLALETKEAKVYKAMDKLEAIISHDEADISSWLPLEYDLQLTYAVEQTAFSPYLTRLREEVDQWTKEKIRENEGKEK